MRPDVQRAGFLEAFLSAEVRGVEGSEIFNKLGVLSTVVQLIKVGSRGEMLPHISQVTVELKDTYAILSILKVKLASALATTQLKPVVTSWRIGQSTSWCRNWWKSRA
jgi:hypothetical protein